MTIYTVDLIRETLSGTFDPQMIAEFGLYICTKLKLYLNSDITHRYWRRHTMDRVYDSIVEYIGATLNIVNRVYSVGPRTRTEPKYRIKILSVTTLACERRYGGAYVGTYTFDMNDDNLDDVDNDILIEFMGSVVTACLCSLRNCRPLLDGQYTHISRLMDNMKQYISRLRDMERDPRYPRTHRYTPYELNSIIIRTEISPPEAFSYVNTNFPPLCRRAE